MRAFGDAMSRFGTQAQGTTLQTVLPYVVAVLCVLLEWHPFGADVFAQFGPRAFLVPLFSINLNNEMDRAPNLLCRHRLAGRCFDGSTFGVLGVFMAGLFYILSSGQKQVLQNAAFSSHWFSFIVVVFIVYLAGFVISLMRDDLDIQFGGHLLSALITGLFYPILAWPLSVILSPSSQEGL